MTLASGLDALYAIAAPVVLFLAFWALCWKPLAGLAAAARVGAKTAAAWFARSTLGEWVAVHAGPFGYYAPILLVLLLGSTFAVVAGASFMELAEEARRKSSSVYRMDQAVHAWMGHEREPALTTLLNLATNVGGTIGLASIVAVVVAALLAHRERASAIFVVVTAVTGSLLNLGLKLIFARARPDLASAIAVADGYAYPSGHAMGSFITLGALAYVSLKQAWPWSAKSAGLAAALTIVVLVGCSRVYLGVHWASDIAGGWSAGAVWLASSVAAFEMLLRLRGEKVLAGECFAGHRVSMKDGMMWHCAPWLRALPNARYAQFTHSSDVAAERQIVS